VSVAGGAAARAEVLGTVVETGPVAARAVLLSDLHLADEAEPAFAAFAAALEFAVRQHADVFVLGDLFDSYVTPAQMRRGVWRAVAERMRAVRARGRRIVVLRGNRDFLLGDEFERDAGIELAVGGHRAVLGGVDTLLLHGDELCQNDVPYQRAKRWLRHPLTRFVARRLPLRLALAVAARARVRSKNMIARGDQDRFLPTAAAVDAAIATGVRRLVFGHIHRHARGRHGAGEYHVLPAFDAESIVLVAADGELQPFRIDADAAAAGPLPLPEPCPFR
jgi:UDP-2,3-diacylglucosamine hydrolase